MAAAARPRRPRRPTAIKNDMAMSRLSVTITAPAILIAALAIGLNVFLNIGKLERTLGELEESRLRFTLSDLRADLETGLDLGLMVAGLGNAQAALDREAARDPDIVSISVLDGAGALVFRSAPYGEPNGGRGGAAPITLSAPLTDNLGVALGALELRYSRRGHDVLMADVARRLWRAGAVALAAVALLAALGIRLWERRVGRALASIAHALDEGAPAPARPDVHAAALAERARHSGDEAQRQIALAANAIDAAAPGRPP